MLSVLKVYNKYFSEDKELVGKLLPIIGFVPRRLHLFKLAFYHKSMNSEGPKNYNNERLEFLGDAILSSIVAEYLFKKYPNKDEGFLTKMRSKIVKRKTLNDIADRMGLDLILSEYSMGKMSNSMLGNALEAMVGALYIELGYEKAKNYFISNVLMKYLDVHELEEIDDNHKSRLLEWCQKNNHQLNFDLKSKFKHNKRDRFKVAVVLNGEEISHAEDYNKKSAEQHAALLAINKLKID
ncbi:MAG TPA: ribonuclease III [Saprospiraceae bacterium]|nr:ribonuclease III [Saprospiraceae bacterium]HRX29338.1 ribonuclease III [Saprospiraceae bacterium]